ncbi:MAG: hypothetical protein J5793_03095 [Clostridia bacterium]|nr:hypothetical protein [Clostridia bacterium]
MIDKARYAAYKAVKRTLGGSYSNLVSDLSELKGVDRSFAERIAIGTVERKITIEFIIDKYLRGETDGDLKALLMTGVYQLFWLDRVPDSAACDETVRIAAQQFGRGKAGFVNAVMRSIVRNKSVIAEEVGKAEPYIRASMDRGLYYLLAKQYPERIGEICDSFFDEQICSVRVNGLKSSAEECAAITGGRIVDGTEITGCDAAKAVENVGKGLYFIQGHGSQNAVKMLSAKEGDTVIDVCACPGGKSLGAAIDMNNRGKIYSFDIHENKLSLICKSAKTLGIDIITPGVWDARTAKPELCGTADRVICDVPCSGTGVMGAKPEIKYRSPDSFDQLYKTQQEILFASSKYLKVGGRMVYSTCSINKAENGERVRLFLLHNKRFSLVEEETLLPCGEGGEGFYTAVITREK